jgi:hypothetical protein
MKTSSFVEELRAIRDAGSDRLMLRRARPQETAPSNWEEEIGHVQETLRDVIRAVCRLSGIELPGPNGDGAGEQALVPLADGETFKDRIRNDLDSFSRNTASELMRKAEEQTRAAMGVLQNEFKVRIDLLSRELRENLVEQFRPEQVQLSISQDTRDRVAEVVDAQTDDFARWVWLCCKGKGRPVASQVEALLEPYSQEAADKFLEAFGLQVQNVVGEQQRLLVEKLQGDGNFIGEQMETVRTASRKALEEDAAAVTQQSVAHLNSVADELMNGVGERIKPEFEGVFGSFQERLSEAVAAAREAVESDHDRRTDAFKQRLESAAEEVKEKSVTGVASCIEETAANAIGSSVDHLHHQASDSLEHSREEIKSFMKLQSEEVRVQIEEMGVAAHEALLKDTTQAMGNLQGLEQEISAARENQMAISQEQLTKGVMESLDSMTGRIREIAGERMEEVNRHIRDTQEASAGEYSARLKQATENCLNDILGRIWQEAGEAGAQATEEFKVNSMSVIQELSDHVDASRAALRQETSEAASRMETALHQSLETYRQQLAEVDEAGLKQQEVVLKGSLRELQGRLIRAANLLVPEDSEAPQPDGADAVA